MSVWRKTADLDPPVPFRRDFCAQRLDGRLGTKFAAAAAKTPAKAWDNFFLAENHGMFLPVGFGGHWAVFAWDRGA